MLREARGGHMQALPQCMRNKEKEKRNKQREKYNGKEKERETNKAESE